MRVDGRHVLVTGASHGIGAELAGELHRRGALVTVLGRDPARLAAVAGPIGAAPVRADLTDPADVDTVIARAEVGHGPVDVLVNNAGLALVAGTAHTERGQAQTLMAVNAIAPMELCRQVLPGMVARGLGQLVNVSSLAGVSAVPDMPLYGASKAALHHYTSVAQRDLRGSGVTVTLVTLGEVAGTAMMEQARQSPTIGAVSRRLSRLMPVLTPPVVAAALADAIERGAPVVTIPRRLAPVIALRNLPSTLQDFAFGQTRR
jgi:short-subunit dehydrogenase